MDPQWMDAVSISVLSLSLDLSRDGISDGRNSVNCLARNIRTWHPAAEPEAGTFICFSFLWLSECLTVAAF
jgi:hypothetical protein